MQSEIYFKISNQLIMKSVHSETCLSFLFKLASSKLSTATKTLSPYILKLQLIKKYILLILSKKY